ncbi:helix-turn-helix transcriptional regulator [Neptunicella marina]|uniref:Response regulator transcription factor n=1 Tax=Neptunicella marina TaxID=2125989 RepID=A0A8J6LZ96_9ALTE|nr:LuxR C-terminal-related transcriptional regulator [Neptunicella marina]MBC3766509.1 response regulator transcription factor [Neptunicella marina]
MKDKIITSTLLIIMCLNMVDVVSDLRLQVPLWHIIEESTIVFISGLMAAYLIMEMRRRTRALSKLGQALTLSEQKFAQLNQEMQIARHQYSEVIRKQLHDWKLSDSEKEVSMLMLKGLNFQEIASLRNTKEKTVRQQASSIYAKSGLEGRHEFAAWFLEDFLS